MFWMKIIRFWEKIIYSVSSFFGEHLEGISSFFLIEYIGFLICINKYLYSARRIYSQSLISIIFVSLLELCNVKIWALDPYTFIRKDSHSTKLSSLRNRATFISNIDIKYSFEDTRKGRFKRPLLYAFRILARSSISLLVESTAVCVFNHDWRRVQLHMLTFAVHHIWV